MAAALFRLDPHFACAFVVETVRQCEEVFKLVAELLPEAVARRQAVVWSTGHDERADDEATQREHGFRPLHKFLHDDLKAARIVIVTHKKWLGEMRHGSDAGVRRHRGRPRDLIYIDEHPELVTLVDQQPHQVLAFRDALYGTDPEHLWSKTWGPILEKVVARMNEAFRSDGATYVPVELVTPEEVSAFGGVLDHDLLGFTRGTDPERRRAEAAKMEQTVRFLRAAANGCVFLSRQEPRAFWAYELDFRAEPGYVLLDATADLSKMAVLMKGMEDVEVPPVDFGNLRISHIQPPPAFSNVNKLVKTARGAAPYAQWIRRTVLAHTAPGDLVLVVAHKALFDHDYLERSEDPEQPLD